MGVAEGGAERPAGTLGGRPTRCENNGEPSSTKTSCKSERVAVRGTGWVVGGKQRARSAVWTCLRITTQPHPGPPPACLTPAGASEQKEKRCPRCPGGHRRFSHAARSSLRPGRGGGGGGALSPAG